MTILLAAQVKPIDLTHLAIAALLVVAAGVVSLLLRLELEKRLFVAALRTVVQLSLIGFVLKEVFASRNLWLVLGVTLVMVGAAAHAAVKRSSRSFRGVMGHAFFSLVLSGYVTVWVVTRVVVQMDPWWEPQYMIPLLGMILGNSLNGISLALDQLLETLKEKAHEVEMELACGASKWEAARRPLADAVRRGMMPIINSMSVVGLVSLPGMMTGQILAGSTPLDAVKYQIVVMFMIAAATSFGAILIALQTYLRLFNDRHQLRTDWIESQS